jgi:branched-chain amino acid transport system substrate-binding protein
VKRNRAVAPMVLLAAGSLAMAACGSSSSGATAGTHPKTVVIGLVTDFSGPQGVLGTMEFQGDELAIDQINAAGGIKSLGGAKLVIKKFDTQTSPDQGALQATKAIAAGVNVIFGGEVSDTVIAGTNVSHRAGIPWLSTGAEAAEITSRGFNDVFQMTSTTNQVARQYHDLLVYVASKLGVTADSMGLSVSDTTYGNQLDTGFSLANTSGPFKVVNKVSYPLGTADLSPIAARMLLNHPAVLLNEGYPTDGVALAQLFATRFHPAAKVFYATAQASLIQSQLGTKADGMLLGAGPSTAFTGMPASYLAAAKAFQAKFGISLDNQSLSTITYVQTMMLRQALEMAGSTKGSAIAAALHKVQLTHAEGNLYPVTTMSFAANGSLVTPPEFYVQMQHGKQVGIFPASIAQASPIPYTP